MKRRAIVAVLALMGCGDPVAPFATHSSTPATAPLNGTVSGTVRLAGKLPPRGNAHEPLAPDGRPIDNSKAKTFILGEGQTLANVYLAVKAGLGDRKFATPREPVILDQVGFHYSPRVLGVMTGQTLRVRNRDDHVHNLYISPRAGPMLNCGFNRGQEETLEFPKAELAIPIKCDVHPWMNAWLHVSDHPFFAVTGLNGAYSIPGLPPGEYEILAWHEGFQKSPLVANVKVESSKTSTLDFTFELPRK